ncbi:MAG: hypothetical protein LQ349_003972 [Xanthoria aureola]|nr:MAG: hypothetical protein LQ349_003972 [Xanthoria aureola]
MENLRTIVASTLRLDSLASTELADELSSSFGIPVAATLLLDADLLTLCHQLDITEGSVPAKKPKVTWTTSKAVRPEPQLSPPKEQKECAARQKLLEMLSRHDSGTSSSTSLSLMLFTPKSPEAEKIQVIPETSAFNFDPVKILADCSLMFSSSAKHNGFTGHWDVIALKYDKIVLAYIVEAFTHLGSDLRSIQLDGSVPPIDFQLRHSQIIHYLWGILERQGVIYRKNGITFRTSKHITEDRSSQLTRGYIAEHPNYTVDFPLMALTRPVLADCLTGAADPLKILFGNPKAQQALDDFYHESPVLATMKYQLVAFIKQALTQISLDVNTRIIEILQKTNRRVEYTFTDIAPTLVETAKMKFSEYSWMDFGTVNLDQDAPAKYHGRYGIVIAMNVVHATKDLLASTSAMKYLPKNRGIICLSEITKVINWHNIVFGLLPGWRSFMDGRTFALQSAEEWMKVFKKAGFGSMDYSTGSTLMIHGGGYMTLSRKAIRPLQTRFLLQNGILAIGLDHRLCPEVNIIDGPMADIRDAVAWARSKLPAIALDHGNDLENSKIAVIEWSTGGHLAMTTAWMTVEAGMEPPTAILNFYGPSDFEASGPKHDDPHLNWLIPSDLRSNLILSLNHNTSSSSNNSLIFNHLGPLCPENDPFNPLSPQQQTQPRPYQTHLNAINPLHQFRDNNYHSPTFVVPVIQSVVFHKAMMEKGLESGVLIIEAAKHIHDVGVPEGSEMWIRGIGPGYEFFLEHLKT